MITKLHLKNFLSFKDTVVHFDDFNVILGANASGKSNLIKAILVLKTFALEGVFHSEDSYSDFMETYFRKNSDPKENLYLECRMKNSFKYSNANSELELTLNDYNYSVECSSEEGIIKEEYYAKINQDPKTSQILVREKRTAKILNFDSAGKNVFSQINLSQQMDFSTLINKTNSNLPVALIAGIQNTVLYKLDSIQIIRASTWKNQKLVNPTGSNLAGVLEYYKKYNPQVIDSINEILRRNIPGFKEVKTERLGTKNAVFFSVEELDGHTYSMNELSDGTDYFIAIITALVVLQYSDLDESNKGLLIIEEPEKCLHPQLLSEIVEIAKHLSAKYQVIITSHSADLVSLLKPEELLLMDKDENGSRIKRCNSSKQLETFLKEFSLDQAWLFNELEGGVVYG